jgi:hypothetical protein
MYRWGVFEMKVSELTNEQLDYYCGKINEWEHIGSCQWFSNPKTPEEKFVPCYRPSTNWQQAGGLVEKYRIVTEYDHDNFLDNDPCWYAFVYDLDKPIAGYRGSYEEKSRSEADTPCRAICMAVIASVYGDEIEEVSNG